jgi:hypothetical protein
MKRWLVIGIGAALLGMLMPTIGSAEGTCMGRTAGNGTCQGVFLGRDTAGRGFIYIGDGTERMYIWSSNRTAATGPDSYVGRALVSHETTVESGLSDINIRRGNVTLTDSMGVPIN